MTYVAFDRYEKKVKDYNFGSLIRTDARQEYSETNTIFVTRIQVRPVPPVLPPSLLPPRQKAAAAGVRVCRIRTLMAPCPLPLQFYVFEIARNRLGLNDKAHEIAKEEAAKEKEKAEKEAREKTAGMFNPHKSLKRLLGEDKDSAYILAEFLLEHQEAGLLPPIIEIADVVAAYDYALERFEELKK